VKDVTDEVFRQVHTATWPTWRRCVCCQVYSTVWALLANYPAMRPVWQARTVMETSVGWRTMRRKKT
jgi:hypothetical protein